MKKITQEVAGRTATILVPENQDDLEVFLEWLEKHKGETLALDTETTGLDIFSDGFRCRTIQVGIGLEAWVIVLEDLDADPQCSIVERIVENHDLIIQYAGYDALVLKQCFWVDLDWDRVTDTKILAHLVDSRDPKEGGAGVSLVDTTRTYIDAEVAEDIKMSMTKLARELKIKKSELFATIDAWNEDYLRYAGMDVVLTYGVHNVLLPLIPETARGLIRVEHDLERVCTEIGYNGFLLDVDYAQGLSDELKETEEGWAAVAYNEYGTESVNANAQVAQDLLDSGVTLNKLTPSGEYKLDKTVIDPLAKQGHTLAIAVVQAKKAKKWRTSWVDKFLDTMDSENRCHATINSLLARTARMSITGIPAQTLPSSDWMIRRCFIPDPGEVIVSCDYQAQELRVLAALSQDRNMMQAFAENADLHQITADASGVARSVGKTVNFAYVYGSGPANIAETCGISVPEARKVIKGFETAYPGVKEYSDRLQAEAKANGFITTPSGRRLYVDSDRAYAALNYMIQSTSRDITAAALLRLDASGFTPYIRLPIHDEILASVPEDKADWGAQKIAEIMATDFMGVHIGSDADVYGSSWGGGYIDGDEDQVLYDSTFG